MVLFCRSMVTESLFVLEERADLNAKISSGYPTRHHETKQKSFAPRHPVLVHISNHDDAIQRREEGVGHLQQAGLILLMIAVNFTALIFIKKWHKSLIIHRPSTDYNQQSVVSSGCSRVVLGLRYKDEGREDNNIINGIHGAEMNLNVIESHRIIIGTKIGKGQFGQLFRGFYITNDQEGQTVMQSVAIKRTYGP